MQGVLDTTLCDKVCQWLAAGQGFSLGTPVSSSTNKTDHHDIPEILLKVALNTITLTSLFLLLQYTYIVYKKHINQKFRENKMTCFYLIINLLLNF